MKSFLFITFLICIFFANGQIRTGYCLPDSFKILSSKSLSSVSVAGSCASPNGSMNSTASPPPNYAWLQANGYCKPGSYGSAGTVCWSFTPTQNSVSINSGYSSSGCGSIFFGPFTLYTCAPGCVNKGTGLSFTVTPGQCYTWCMTYNGNGGFCAFSDFCPYFQQTTVLPIELFYFAGSYQNGINVLAWSTMSEHNTDYFILERSLDAISWSEVKKLQAAGESSKIIEYRVEDDSYNLDINYYRLKQVDKDQSYAYFGIVAIDNNLDLTHYKLINITNLLGQSVDESYEGVQLRFYSNGSILKFVKN